MFEQLFVKAHAIARHAMEPLSDERRRFLVHLKELGLPRVTLRWHADMLLRVAETLRLAERPNEMISRAEVVRRATDKRHKFVSVATRWLRFLGRLQEELPPASPYDEQLEAFADFSKRDRGLCGVQKNDTSQIIERKPCMTT